MIVWRRLVALTVLVLSVGACRGAGVKDEAVRAPAPPNAAPPDAAPPDAAPPDAAPPQAAAQVDAGANACAGHQRGSCPQGETCHSCSRAVRNTYFCTTACQSDADCKDPNRPSCEGAPSGFCAQKGMLHRCRSKCAAPDTPVLTPTGERAIASLREGDLVFSVHAGRTVIVPLVEIRRTPVTDHQVVRVTLASGAILLMSEGHPTAEGRELGGLAIGDRLGDATVVGLESVPYPFDATHDILPDSDSGAYFAAGALVGSTLRP